MVMLVLFRNGAFAKQRTAPPPPQKKLTIFKRKIIKPILTEKRKGSCWKFFQILLRGLIYKDSRLFDKNSELQ